MSEYDIKAMPASENCRRINFEKAEVVPGIIPHTWFLVVSGTKPCINMEVSLQPLVYIRCPEYWGIEVVGCLPGGICLTATGPYSVALQLNGTIGCKGIEVLGARHSEPIEVPDGCDCNGSTTS
ncbi:MAG TPA: hypothetical protein VF746_08655 [Longimicrobium sp.]|jgi:hypothetical protein